jgi:hypothetical protein
MSPARIEATIVTATACPALAVAGVACVTGRKGSALRLRRWAGGVPPFSLLVTAVLWIGLLWSGALYPVFDAGNLRYSWGGPTLVGAWAVHLLIWIAGLLGISFLLALWRSPDAASRELTPRSSPSDRGRTVRCRS